MDLDTSITELRANLSQWLQRVRVGDEVVVTDRGVPIARIQGLGTTSILERLTIEGKISPPRAARRLKASGRSRPRSRRPLEEIVSEQRR